MYVARVVKLMPGETPKLMRRVYLQLSAGRPYCGQCHAIGPAPGGRDRTVICRLLRSMSMSARRAAPPESAALPNGHRETGAPRGPAPSSEACACMSTRVCMPHTWICVHARMRDDEHEGPCHMDVRMRVGDTHGAVHRHMQASRSPVTSPARGGRYVLHTQGR